jgi:hypothetical protein
MGLVCVRIVDGLRRGVRISEEGQRAELLAGEPPDDRAASIELQTTVASEVGGAQRHQSVHITLVEGLVRRRHNLEARSH